MGDPIRLDDFSIEQIAKLSRGSSTGIGSNTGSIASDSLNILSKSAGAVTDGFTGLITGTTNLTSTFNAANSIIGQFGPLGQTLSKVVGPLSGTFLQVNESVRRASDSGVYFGNNLGLYAESILGARMSLQDFNDIVKYNSNSLAGLSLGADRSAKTFLDLAKGVQQSELGNQLKDTGVSAEFLNQVLLSSASSRKFIDLSQTRSQNELVNSALKVATEMDNVARLTGISRQEQQKDLDRQLQKASVQAMMSQMTVTQQNNFIESLGSLRKQGKSVQELFEEISTGGIRSSEGSERAAALNVISGQLVPILTEIARLDKSDRPEDKARAEELRKQFEIEFARGVSSENTAKIVEINARSTDKTMVALREMYQQGLPAASVDIQAKYAAARTPGMTVDQARDEILKQADKDRKGEVISAEAMTSRTINKMDVFMKDAAAGAAKGFSTLNSETGNLIGNFKGINNILKPYKQEELSPGAIITNSKSLIQEAMPVKTAPKSAKPADYEPVKRQEGSMGTVGKWIEDFGKGTPAVLHGKEGVITEKQFNDLFNGAFNGLQGNIKTNTATMKRSVGNAFSEAVSDFKTNIKGDTPSLDRNIENVFSNTFGNIQHSIKGESLNIERSIGNMFGGIQTNLSMELEKTKASIPTVRDFETMLQKLVDPNKNAPGIDQPSQLSVPVQPATTELKEELVRLNMLMSQLLAQTSEVANNTSQQVRATKSLSGNILA